MEYQLDLEQVSNLTEHLRKSRLEPPNLEQAFSLFNKVSAELTGSYQKLQNTVEKLTDRLNLLLEALPGGVIVLDNKNIITEINPAAELIFNGNIIGLDWIVFSERLLMPTLSPNEWDIRAEYQTDTVQRLSISSRDLEDQGKILLIQNITENYLLHKKLEHHKRLSLMGEMAAGLAHQLRTPLATALLYNSNMTKENLSESERIKFANKSLIRLRHLERLIQDMLSFVRGEENQNQEDVDIFCLLQEVVQIIEPQFNVSKVNLITEGLDFSNNNKLIIHANRKALMDAILNLLENAMQFTPQNGFVKLSAELLGSKILINIADSGCGIETESLDRIFDPFFTTRRDGTGLGLSIVRRIIESHNGEISVESQMNQGSSFTIQLITQYNK